MLRELITFLRADDPLNELGDSFARMFQLTHAMAVSAGDIFFEGRSNPEERAAIYRDDVAVNELERSIRKSVVIDLTVAGSSMDVPYGLMLMSLVKDVERLGDYAKNLSELVDIRSGPLPDDENTRELRELRVGVEKGLAGADEILRTSNRELALTLIRRGRHLAHRADALIERLSKADYDAATTTVLVLACRYYKRLGGHVLNVLSSFVMPLHKIDYYDESDIATFEAGSS